jgi:hypothetical protein
MEPVFMLLGHSAALAANLAMEKKASVQGVDMPTLQSRLLVAGQILKWTRPAKK